MIFNLGYNDHDGAREMAEHMRKRGRKVCVASMHAGDGHPKDTSGVLRCDLKEGVSSLPLDTLFCDLSPAAAQQPRSWP